MSRSRQEHSFGDTSHTRDGQGLEASFAGLDEPVNPELNENSHSGASSSTEQPSLESLQLLYYSKGLEELESLQLLDLSPLATWKLSSHKQGHGLAQLREDNPETYWQSDGSSENNMEQQPSTDGANLNHPHSILLRFSKKVSLERISIFTNYQLDESYTPLRIKIMAGASNWDLTEVCVVNFEKPIGWSHIIFKGVRGDGLLKCFLVKIIILANHQDGKDSHIRAIRCFGKNLGSSSLEPGPLRSQNVPLKLPNLVTNTSSASGISLNGCSADGSLLRDQTDENYEGEKTADSMMEDEENYDPATYKILSNVTEVLRFNSGFESIELKSVSSIR